MASFPPPPKFLRPVPTETQSDLAAIVSAIRLLSHIATPDACRRRPGLYRNVAAAATALRNIHDILAAPETDEARLESRTPQISPYPKPGGIQ